MAGPASSSSSFGSQWPYDVFLNFRGEDTRNSFVGNLFNALRQKGIQIFMDDGELKKGDEITPSLFKAIEESRMAITVFSKNYASSTFCLDELVKILQCIKGNDRLVLPIFYDVEPSYVRHQKGNYEEALAKHQKNFKANEETIQNWKLALREAANLSGLHFNPGYEYEYKFIEKIVNEISSKINRTLLNITKYPIGLESRVSKINSRLQVESCDQVIMLGICGVGGIGKSTIARAVFNSIADQFEGLCFLDDIKENSSKLGLEQLQERILSNILGVNIKVECANKGIPIIKRRLNQKKILLILDNVDKEEQLENLAGNCDWFGSGSRIIITTRDKHLLATHGVERLYEVEAFNNKESLDLLSWNAFKMNQVDPSYMKVLTCVVNYAKGLPLALQVIGSHLFGKSIEEWKSAIDIYKRIPNEEVQKILKVSYDGLGEVEKEIFLDIASFFKGHGMIYVKEMVQYAHGFNPTYGIGVLMDKCLIDIENDCVKMHDLIQDMGRELVRQESSTDPGKRSRLWNHEDIIQVLENNTGTDKINCIIQDNFFEDIKVNWDGKAFKKIKNLKILIFKKASFSQGPKHLPNYLRVLQWPKYPSSWLPVDFHPKKLAILDLRDCCFRSLEPIKKFENLNILSFANSQFITHIPDLSCAPNLKELVVDNCENLIEIHDGYMGKLEALWAQGCVMLRTFPHSINLPSLTFLELSECITVKKISKIFEEMEHVTQLDLSKMNFEFSCSIRELAVDYFRMIALLPKVESTYLRADKVTEELSSMQRFKISQVEANISNELLSMYLGWFGHVETLQLSFSNFTVLPACINECHRLMTLVLNDCKHLSEIKGIPPNICTLEVDNCPSLSSKSKSILLSKELHEWGDKNFLVPGASIPEWFDHCSEGPSISFWFRNNFPIISLCFVFKLLLMDEELVSKFLLVDVIINGKEIFHAIKVWKFYGWNGSLDHILCACVLNCSIFNNSELNEVLVKSEWNHVEVHTYMTVYDELDGKEIEAEWIRVKEIGMNVMEQGNRMVDIQFINPFKSIFKGSSNPLLIWDYEKLWKLQLPEKIKIFLWKAIHNELAIKDNLTIRGTNMYDYTCPNCGAVAESIMHTLVACPFAEVIWSMPPLMLRSQSLPQASFSSWWEGLSSSLSYCQVSVGMLEIAGFICWRIWKCRNAKVLNGGSREARQVILLVMQQVNEFQASLQGMRDWLIALPKIDEEEVISRVRSNAEVITLKECNISDELLQICCIRFANVKYLDLSGNNFTVLSAHIKECRFLEKLILDDCKYLREIRGIPSNIFILSAINCTSLSSESTNLVLSQELLEEGDKEFWVPGARIPKLFEHCSRGPSIYFWFRNKFPAIYFCFIIPEDKSVCTKCLGDKVIINGKEIFNDRVWNHKLLADHIFVYSLRMRDFPDNEMDHLFHKNMWNHVEVCIYLEEYNGEYEIGMNVIKAESRMEDIKFTNPYTRRKLESLNWDSIFMTSSRGTASDKDLQQPRDLNRRSLTWDPMEWECPVDRLEDKLDLNDQAGTICDKGSLNPLLLWDYEKLWKLQLPEKIKIFLWKALHNELAIKGNLTIRGTNIYDHTCPNCGAVAESIMHTLVACPFAEVIWSMSPLMLRSQSLSQASFSSWWEGLSRSISYLKYSMGMLEIAGFICWRIWKCRNAKAFNRGSMGARQVILLVMQQVNEFQVLLQGRRVISTLLRSNAENITLKECSISDEFLPTYLAWFVNVKYLDLSCNNFTVLPAHIKECRFLEELILDDCKHLREIREIPSNIFLLSAINCTSLSSESTNLLLSQELLEEGDKEFCVPGARIPKLFEHCSRGPSIYFWFRNKFPAIYLCFIIPWNKYVCRKYVWAKVIINGKEIFNNYVWNHEFLLLADHIFVYTLRMRDFTDNEMHHVFHKNMWNYVEVCIDLKGYNGEYEIGMNVIKAESRLEDIQFTDPYKRRKLKSLNWDSVFKASSCGTASDKDLQQPRDLNSRDLTWDPMEREYPVDMLEDRLDMNDQAGTIHNKGAKTSKIFLGSAAEAEHEPMFQKGGKLKEDVNLVPGSTSPVSTSTNKEGGQKNDPSNIKISKKDASIKRNTEATVHYKQNKAEKSHTQLPESRANQQSAAKEIEDGLISPEAFITEDNMDAFYASLETETTALSDTQINSVFVNTRPSEETQKALQILRDLVSKKFSLLLQPEESKSIKYILEYLLSLSPDDGISLKTKSVILQLSRSFSQWSLDYNDASHKLESAGADLAKVDELKEGLEANVREFQEVENFENEMWSKLADLEEEKRKLEEQINDIKAQIADYMSSKDTAAQRKRMVFDHGRRLKAKRDDLRNRVPRLRAEQEWAKINQANIEDEWLKLGEQFIASSSFEDWT